MKILDVGRRDLSVDADIKNVKIKDSNGYYRIILGVLNSYNENGRFYRVKDLDKITNKESILGKRLYDGILRSEYDHPGSKGMTLKEHINRTVIINIDRVCAHIKKIEFITDTKCEVGWEGLNRIYVVGWVKPSGPYGKYLEEYLNNRDENVSFSIRCLLNPSDVDPKVFDVVEISTYDFVFEQGIRESTAWNAAGYENIDLSTLYGEDIDELITGMESNECPDSRCLIKVFKDMKTKSILDWQ